MRRIVILTIVVCCLAAAQQHLQAAERPNIVIIMADDLGLEAIPAYGAEGYRTPNLDRLAASGMCFANCFANPICTPSRVKIMTGLCNDRNYVGFGKLDRGQFTFGHALKAAGYATAIAGKWQLGKEPDAPQHFGFDQALLWQHTAGRTHKGHDSRYENPYLQRNGEAIDYTNGEYGPDLFVDFLLAFSAAQRDRPVLLYYPMALTHCPFVPTPDSDDWDPTSPGSPSYRGDPKYFPDMLHYVDRQVGRLLQGLQEQGKLDNTLVIFTGDNGTDKVTSRWRGQDITGGKGMLNDFGTRVALFVRGPGIAAGGTSDTLVDFSDIMPTVCEAAGAELGPHGSDGVSLMPVLRDSGERDKPFVYIWYEHKKDPGSLIRTADHVLRWKQHDPEQEAFFHSPGPFVWQRREDPTADAEEAAVYRQLRQHMLERQARRGDALGTGH